MTEVAFHFNAADRLAYACRLLRKAYRLGARLQVVVEGPLAAELDQRLWTMKATEFVPHAASGAGPVVLRHSPIVIGPEPVSPSHPDMVLVNLSDEMPQGFDRFARVIEIVSNETQGRERARERWKRYKASGLDPQHLDIQKAAA